MPRLTLNLPSLILLRSISCLMSVVQRAKRLSQILFSFLTARVNLVANHRMSDLSICVKYSHPTTIWEQTFDSFFSCVFLFLKWWSSRHDTEKSFPDGLLSLNVLSFEDCFPSLSPAVSDQEEKRIKFPRYYRRGGKCKRLLSYAFFQLFSLFPFEVYWFPSASAFRRCSRHCSFISHMKISNSQFHPLPLSQILSSLAAHCSERCVVGTNQ